MVRLAFVAAALAIFCPAGLSARQCSPDHPLRNFIRTLAERGLDPAVRYTSEHVDLNGDGRVEAVVRIMGPRYCGTGGCGLYVLERRTGRWRVVTHLSITHAPIRVLNTRTRGWRDLGVIVAGGGITRAYEARLRFDGRTYPGSPSMPPAMVRRGRASGRTLIGRTDRGRPLF